MIIVEAEITIQEIDEALLHLKNMLEDKYGNRLSYQKRKILLDSVDDLLDARLRLSVK
jgi:hypothetical protein